MFQTRVFEFQNGKWVPIMRGYIAICGHWHWDDLRPRPKPPRSPGFIEDSIVFSPAINFPVQGTMAEVIRHRK